MKFILGALVVFTISSCSSGIRNELSINCQCSVAEHYSVSTDSEDNRTKEFTFTDSPIFKFGVPEEYFATSCAVLINNDSKIDSTTFLKIILEKNKGGSKKNKSYKYDIYELSEISPKYFEILEITNDFVVGIYNKQYKKCYDYIGFEFDKEQLDLKIDSIRNELEQGYIETRIIGFDKRRDNYTTYGAIYTENQVLDLFIMHFNETKEGLRIKKFQF